MNKALHALVYVTLVVAAAALFFEFKLYDKKDLLKDRNRQLEDYLVKISNTIEKSDAAKPSATPEARKDISAVDPGFKLPEKNDSPRSSKRRTSRR